MAQSFLTGKFMNSVSGTADVNVQFWRKRHHCEMEERTMKI